MMQCVARAVRRGGLVMLLLAGACGPALAVDIDPAALAVARQVLGAKDGWAAAEGGTTGGAAATDANIHVVSSRAQLIAALGGDNASNGKNTTPAIIFIKGDINLNADDAGRDLTVADYAQNGYSQEAYIAAYDPAVWGKKKVEGPMEDARKASKQQQLSHVIIDVGSNKTLIGLGKDAKLRNGTVRLSGAENVIIRNISFEDSYDMFPEWDPEDGKDGAWNSEYDLLVLTMGSKRVWIDHNSFSDGARPDHTAQLVYGQKMQHHDGAIDIVRQSNYVTVSYNHIKDHDKTMLFGNSDGRKEDAGHIKATVHHNYFENSGQRSPRVRYGEVHVYNNYYTGAKDRLAYPYVYALGVGIDSRIYSQNNVFDIQGITADKLLEVFKGTRFFDSGSLFNGQPVDILAASNAAKPKAQLTADVGWTPQWVDVIHPADAVAAHVQANAGVGKILP